MDNQQVRRLFVEKQSGFDVEAQNLFQDLSVNLSIDNLNKVRIVHRYDLSGIHDEVYQQSRYSVFAEPTVDWLFDEELVVGSNDKIFAVEYLPGQYDQRADSAAQCIQILTQGDRPKILYAKVVILSGDISAQQFAEIKAYCINPVDSREADMDKPLSLELVTEIPADVAAVQDFIAMDNQQIGQLYEQLGLAMSLADLYLLQEYFRDTERRDPTITELRVIDTYWSDHCRHTTFLTTIEHVEFEDSPLNQPVQDSYADYLEARKFVYGEAQRDVCLMDIAVIGMKELKRQGRLPDLDESEEINACSIVVSAEVDGQEEEWLVMFKNETHNHPTEIEPFGGAATCLGGAIRDPLSGRSYVYQAMRVTGSGDPRRKVEETLPGKLPQRKITTGAAAGYSSYGNQIGLATGQVAEVYDEGFVAKRMEIGAVIAAAPRQNVVRINPVEGDIVILVGGRTGRDGCGGATGSSKEHDEDSIVSCGAEVQKGNPPEERKIQRLFRNPEVSTMVKRCNDFGAGGVSVAIGELTDGLVIDLDAVLKKYEGLDGTELAISESQERMAVVVDAAHAQRFIDHARGENLEATIVAKVTGDNRLKMAWRGQTIVDISRDFLNTNGVKQTTKVKVVAPKAVDNYFRGLPNEIEDKVKDLGQAWKANLQQLNVCSQKGLVERFDSTIGAGTVLMPFGGKYQATPTEAMVAKLPVLKGDTSTGTIMTYGYNPQIGKWSPYHGALYAVIEAVTKVVTVGGDFTKVRLTLQEYFEKLGKDEVRWGKPFSALLGAFHAQRQLGIPAIGGKDSMSGTFKDLNVPPTLVAFAVAPVDVRQVISPDLKSADSVLVLVSCKRNEQDLPDFEVLKSNYSKVTGLIQAGQVRSAHTVRNGGIAEAITKMAFGNGIGVKLEDTIDAKRLFAPDYGSMILEMDGQLDWEGSFGTTEYQVLGYTQATPEIQVAGNNLSLNELLAVWEAPLEQVFPTQTAGEVKIGANMVPAATIAKIGGRVAKPQVFIPVFPGTNCEYDSALAFQKAGALTDTLVFRNLTAKEIEEAIDLMVQKIDNSQIVMIPGGFSAGDEPEGSGKFIATVFRNPRVKDAVDRLLKQRDGLMLGICNGFQALIKLGLVPYGEIVDISKECPTLTFNTIGRHVSCMVQTKVVSNMSPWLQQVRVGDVHTIPVSHGEGRFVASEQMLNQLMINGQIATQYVDLHGAPSGEIQYNPNGSVWAIEGITSPDGRVFGKMGHSERVGTHVAINVPGEKDQRLFVAGVSYFK